MKRFCYYIPLGQCDEKGFIPSVVIEGESGHSPMKGQGEFASPWHWGMTMEIAEEIARDKNTSLGLTQEDVDEIVASSMFASV